MEITVAAGTFVEKVTEGRSEKDFARDITEDSVTASARPPGLFLCRNREMASAQEEIIEAAAVTDS